MTDMIKDSPQIYKLAQELMSYTGESLAQTIITALEEKLSREKVKTLAQPEADSPRVLGLHQGQGWMSEDFTEALPDEFWLGLS